MLPLFDAWKVNDAECEKMDVQKYDAMDVRGWWYGPKMGLARRDDKDRPYVILL